MRKTLLTLISLCVSVGAFAETQSVVLINAEPTKSMILAYQICTVKAGDFQHPYCDEQASKTTLSGMADGKNSVKVTVPADTVDDQGQFASTSFVQVINADAYDGQVKVASSKYDWMKACEASRTGDVLVFDSFGTKGIVCNDHGSI